MRLISTAWIPCLLICLVGCQANSDDLGFTQQEWAALSGKERIHILQQAREQVTTFSGVTDHPVFKEVTVRVSGGSALLWPQKQRGLYQAGQVALKDNTCQILRLSKQTLHADLNVCYREGVVFLDPSHWDLNKKPATLYLYQTPLWRKGLAYKNIHSEGQVSLRQANIYITGHR